MKHLIITGFDPFGGESINPAWEAVSRLPDTVGGYRLTKLQSRFWRLRGRMGRM